MINNIFSKLVFCFFKLNKTTLFDFVEENVHGPKMGIPNSFW